MKLSKINKLKIQNTLAEHLVRGRVEDNLADARRIEKAEREIKDLEFQHYCNTGRFPVDNLLVAVIEVG